MIDLNAFHYKVSRDDIVISVVIDMKHNLDEQSDLRDKISLFKKKGSKLNVTDSEFRDSLCHKNVAILCHGLLSSKNCATLLTFSECLLQNVPYLHAILRLDFHGNGESSGFCQWSYGGYHAEVEDLYAIVKTVQDAEGTVSLLLGHSRAATVVLLYGTRYDNVPRIVSVAGRVDMSQNNTSLLSPQQLLSLEKGETVEITDYEEKNRLVTPLCIKRRQNIRVLDVIQNLRFHPIYPKLHWTQLLILHCKDDKIKYLKKVVIDSKSLLHILHSRAYSLPSLPTFKQDFLTRNLSYDITLNIFSILQELKRKRFTYLRSKES